MSDEEEYESADDEVQAKVPTQPAKSEAATTPTTTSNQASSWRSWGAFTAISNVSKNLASATAQVVDNVSQSLSMMSIPEPEEMAKLHKEEETKKQQQSVEDDKKEEDGVDEDISANNNSVFQILTNVSKISSKVVTDTLEGIGKKTINIIQETDPNIKNKIKSIGTNRSYENNLSSLLKEAKERNEDLPIQSDTNVGSNLDLSKLFDNYLDEFKGLMHLEALEVLSKQSKLKIEVLVTPLAGKALSEMQETLNEVEELCEMPDSDAYDESFDASTLQEKLLKATEDLNVTLNFNEIVEYSIKANEWIDSLDNYDANELFKKAIETLAKLCALSLVIYCKLAEKLILLNQHRSTADEVDAITQITSISFSLFIFFTTKFTKKLSQNAADDGKSNNDSHIVTNLFVECSNANSYVKKAFTYFIPILQLGAV